MEIIPVQAERDSGGDKKTVRFPAGIAFTFIPEYCSESHRNSVRLQTGIAFTFDRRTQLVAASRKKVLVKFTRPFEKGSVTGYVMDVGPEFFLVSLVGDGIRFNGFQCFRFSDVRRLEIPARYSRFSETALKKRGEYLPKKPRVLLSSLPKLLSSANRAFPLVTIHREKSDPDVCHIGRVVELSNESVGLLEIGPDANWDDKPETYRLSEITRVDFGGDYEEALHLVGGAPKSFAQ